MTQSVNSKAKAKVRWVRYGLLALGALSAYHIMSGPSGALNLMKLRKSNEEKRASLDSLAARQRDLEVEAFRLERDSAYLEQVARKELGMAKPGEKVFRFMRPE